MKAKQKLRGVSLLSAIFGELSQQLPEGVVSTEELLGAARIARCPQYGPNKRHGPGSRAQMKSEFRNVRGGGPPAALHDICCNPVDRVDIGWVF